MLITDKNKLSTRITKNLKAYKSTGADIHTDFVSSLYHAMKHGDTSLMNRVYNGLRPNDQQAVKLYVRRVFIINGLSMQNDLNGTSPNGMETAEIIKACSIGETLSFTKGAFRILAGPNSDQALSLLKLIESRFIVPDGKTDRRVFDRNNFAEVKTLSDADVLKKIATLAAQLKPTETRKVSVSPGVLKLVSDFAGKAEALAEAA